MANQLSVAKVHSILTLHERGWSQRRIARELGINRETVARYVRQAQTSDSKPAMNAPPGSSPPETGPPGAKPATSANALTGSALPGRAQGAVRTGPVSDCEPYRERILEALSQGLSGVRIHQDLRFDHGDDAPSYHSVRRYIARLRGHSADPFRRIEVLPGEESQVDFGTGAPIIDARGKRHRTHVLRVVLSHSRKGYSEAVVPPDDRRLHPLPRERLSPLRRGARRWCSTI